MADTVLYIAASLDGYIARQDGSLDWLENLPNPDQTDHGYAAFLDTIGTVVMGRTTYEQVLGFGGEWPYATMDTKVVTSRKDFNAGTPSTEVVNHLDAPLDHGLCLQ
jgi:dihydrofolate reductase